MKLAVVGSRNFPKLELVEQLIHALKPETEVLSGGARGVDLTAEKAARKRGLKLRVFYPAWQSQGKSAGPKRNKLLVAEADGLIAFWDGKSTGTFNAIQEAASRHIWLRVVYPNGQWVQCYDIKGVFIQDLK